MRAMSFSAAAVVTAALFSPAPTQAQIVAVHGETVYTMAGAPIKDGVVLIKDGKIDRVGTAAQVKAPAGSKTLRAKVVTPGLVDAHSTVGLSGFLNQPHDQDQLDRSAASQPELRAVDAYNAQDPLVEYLRRFGVTTVHTGHGPGALISGQTMVVKTAGREVEDSLLVPEAMVAVTLGESAASQPGKAPGTRAKAVAMLRADLIKARDYTDKQSGPEDKRPTRDLRLDTLGRVIKKEVPLLVTVNRSTDILTALRIAKEFDVRIVLDGAAEAYLLIDEIKKAGVP